ncbi:hypothetical protein LH464_04255 [Neorhizobium sp. T786]|uniref:hypothetical protein n=1 Tax=Pseudorhizobium xiangyangii TaxID=2883104 RepID=UPI001CFF5B5B|nr:hypothetical protein [Neorhizobium xiangyangii]MCB5201690.1 hypothetical protein [Neorhizobium xiangyangii]
MNVAETILAQLGGNKFRAMTGAKSFVGGSDLLQFDLPRGFAANKATKVRITLDVSDTYTMAFYQWNAKKLDMKQLSEIPGVYADDIRRIFTSETGLDCTLGRAA